MELALNNCRLRTYEFGEVPEVGVEPTHPKVHEFESCASANSATPARKVVVYAAAARLSMGTPTLTELT